MSNSKSSESEYESDTDTIPEEINWSLTIIKNRYIILNKLGSGSYCTVWGIYDVETKDYSYVDIHNPKPFLKFTINSFEDIENGTELLKNL